MKKHPCDLAKSIMLSFDDNTVSTVLFSWANYPASESGEVWDAIYERYRENVKSKNPLVLAMARGTGDNDSVNLLLLGVKRTDSFVIDLDDFGKGTQGDVRFQNLKALRGAHSRRPPTEVFPGLDKVGLYTKGKD